MNLPLVSVIIPNYNHASYLPQRIESVLNQTFQDFELILMDDCSTDNSREIINFYREHPKVSKVLLNTQNSGSPFKQWIKGANEAKGKYVWIAESDDYAAPEFLEKVLKVMEANSQINMAYTNSGLVDASNTTLHNTNIWTKYIHPTRWENDFVNEGRDECIHYLIYTCTIPNVSAVLFQRNILTTTAASIHDLDKFKYSGDWMLYVKILEQGNIAYLAEALNFYRVHPQTVTSRFTKSIKAVKEFAQVIEYIAKYIDKSGEIRPKSGYNFITDTWLRSLKKAGLKPLKIARHFRYYFTMKKIDKDINLKVIQIYKPVVKQLRKKIKL